MSFSHKKGILALCLLLIVSLALVGCGGSDKKDDSKANDGKITGKIMIYTSIYPDIIDRVKPDIKNAFPDLDVQWFQGGTEKVLAKMAGEMQANKIAADLVMVADPSYYLTLKDKDMLIEYISPESKDIAMEKDEKGSWTPVRISNMVIAYNTDKLSAEEAPKSWKDLTDPKWKGKIAMPNPLLSGTAYVAVGALADKYGWEYFDELKANDLKIEEGNSAIQNKLLTGEYLVVVILEENILKMADVKKEPVKVIYPEDGVVMVPSPIGIMKTTQNSAGAKAMVDWWLSKEGQKSIVSGWMHSVRADMEPPVGAPPLKEFASKAVPVNWGKLATEKEQIKEEFRTRVIDKQ